MRFWDSSALVPLVLREASTERMRALVSEDDQKIVWGWSRVEVAAAIERKHREGSLEMAGRRVAFNRLGELSAGWDEVIDLLEVRRRAALLLARHALRSADSGQIAAAQLVADYGVDVEFVTLDHQLARVAELEGLVVLPASQ